MKKLSIILAIFVCLYGCTMYKVQYDYNVSAKNSGEMTIRDVTITSDIGFWHRTGYLPKDAVKTYGGLKPVPPNGIYTIAVENLNKEIIKSIIDLQDIIGKRFRGEIVFIIDENYHVTYRLE